MRSSVKNKIIWTIALPIIFGNLAQTLIALTDTAFLGRVSAVALGASEFHCSKPYQVQVIRPMR